MQATQLMAHRKYIHGILTTTVQPVTVKITTKNDIKLLKTRKILAVTQRLQNKRILQYARFTE